MSSTRQAAVNQLCETIRDITLHPTVRNSTAQTLIKIIKKSDAKELEIVRDLSTIVGESKSIECFVLNGLDLHNKDDLTPLMCAAICDQKEICHMLLDAKVNVDIQNKMGKTALISAISHHHIDMAHILIEANAKLDITTSEKQSALHYAVRQGLGTVVHALIKKGANLDIQDKYGHTALYYAGYISDDSDIAHTLIDVGAKANDIVLRRSCYFSDYYMPSTEMAIALIHAGAHYCGNSYTEHDHAVMIAWINARNHHKSAIEPLLNHYLYLPPELNEMVDSYSMAVMGAEEIYNNNDVIHGATKIISSHRYRLYADFHWGYDEEQKGNIKSAKKYYQKSCKIGYLPAYQFLAKLYEKQGKLDKAAELTIIATKKGDPFSLKYMLNLSQKIASLPNKIQAEEKNKKLDIAYGIIQSLLMEKAFEFILLQQFNVYLAVSQWLLLAETAIAHDSFETTNGFDFAYYALCKAQQCSKTETEKSEVKETIDSIQRLHRHVSHQKSVETKRDSSSKLSATPFIIEITETIAGYVGHSQREKAIKASLMMFGIPMQKEAELKKISYSHLSKEEKNFVGTKRSTSATPIEDFWNLMTVGQQMKLRREYADYQNNKSKCSIM